MFIPHRSNQQLRAMALWGLPLAVISLLFLTAFAPAADRAKPGEPTGCDSIPALNHDIIEFARGKLNQKVGQGEAWDLVAEALNAAGAKWDGETNFGRKIDPAKECVLAGDIIHFSKFHIDYREDGVLYKENLSDHMAIIYAVISQSHFTLIEQNTGRLGQKVGESPLELRNLKSGKYKVYRPERK